MDQNTWVRWDKVCKAAWPPLSAPMFSWLVSWNDVIHRIHYKSEIGSIQFVPTACLPNFCEALRRFAELDAQCLCLMFSKLLLEYNTRDTCVNLFLKKRLPFIPQNSTSVHMLCLLPPPRRLQEVGAFDLVMRARNAKAFAKGCPAVGRPDACSEWATVKSCTPGFEKPFD